MIVDAIDQATNNADNTKSVKFLRNGQVLILRGSTLYSPPAQPSPLSAPSANPNRYNQSANTDTSISINIIQADK